MTVSIRRACLVTAGLAVALTVPAASQSPAQQPGQTPTFKA
jgi:hypothetical protein